MDNLLARIAEENINLIELNPQQSLTVWCFVAEHFAQSDTEKAYALLMCSEFEVQRSEERRVGKEC